jgi:hypothetical protein
MSSVTYAQNVTLQGYGPPRVFLISKIISYLIFPNFTHNIKAGTTYGRRLLIATQLDQSNHLANQQFSHPRLLVIYFFPTSPIKLKLGPHMVGDY